MTSHIPGQENLSALDVCVSLGIYFSALNEGAFKDNVIMFNSTSERLQLKGKFTEKCGQVPANAMGGTNFQSVIDEIVRIRKANPSIPIEDYPTTLLVVSDMQFNPTSSRTSYYGSSYGYRWNKDNENTNYEEAMAKLTKVGLTEINIIWWDVTGRGRDVPVRKGDARTALLSGFDGAIITEILGGNEQKALDMTEVMNTALGQDLLMQITLPE